MVSCLRFSHPKKVARRLRPLVMNVSIDGMNGIRVRPLALARLYVWRISVPLGQLSSVSAELSLTRRTSTCLSGCKKGHIGLFWFAAKH
jgi:hypothetical protein